MTDAKVSETPRTDAVAQWAQIFVGCSTYATREAVPSYFSRTLERELSAAREALREAGLDAERYRFCIEHGFPMYHYPRSASHSFADPSIKVGTNKPEFWVASIGEKNYRGATATESIDMALDALRAKIKGER